MARLKPEERKEQILEAAIKLAKREGYNNIRRDDVAAAANVSMGLVNAYFKTIKQLKRAVMRAAIHREILEIIAQGMLAKDNLVAKISDDLKQRAANHLIG